MANPYFNTLMVNRLVLSWAVATRLQLDRWEPLVAENARNVTEEVVSPCSLIWQAQFEHHYCLIAATHLLTSLRVGKFRVRVNPVVANEIAQGRDLYEHWKENMPVFNLSPQSVEPGHPTGKAFAARNPNRSPYFWLGWDNKVGPKLLPNVPSTDVHALLDRAQSHVLRAAPEMSTCLLPRPESSWVKIRSQGWWPRPRDTSVSHVEHPDHCAP